MDVTYRFSGFSADPVRRLLFGPDGEPIALKPRVFDTLLYLIEHRGELLQKQALLDAIWPHVVVEENNLNKRFRRCATCWRDARRASLHRDGARARVPVRRPRGSSARGIGYLDARRASVARGSRAACSPARGERAAVAAATDDRASAQAVVRRVGDRFGACGPGCGGGLDRTA